MAVLGVYADMSGTERKVERQRRGKGADRVRPEAQWSGVEINSPSLHHRESASLGCLRGETRKADKSCARGSQIGMNGSMAREKIDPLLKKLIADLNKAGFTTNSSCQGKTCQEDYEEDRHCEHSFISFTDETVLSKRRAKARKLGLFIYNGDVSITALSGRETKAEIVFKRNLSFVPKMRELFKLG